MPQKTNIKLDTYPELVQEWHPIKNQGKEPLLNSNSITTSILANETL